MKALQKRVQMRDEGGFTLIELLVVIAILGILAAVVVFAVGSLGDKGQLSACKTDVRTIRTAQEAYANAPGASGQYAVDEDALVAGKWLGDKPTLHTTAGVDTDPDGASGPETPDGTLDTYTVTQTANGKCDGLVDGSIDPTP